MAELKMVKVEVLPGGPGNGFAYAPGIHEMPEKVAELMAKKKLIKGNFGEVKAVVEGPEEGTAEWFDEEYTVKELKAMLDDSQIEYDKSAKKADLIALIMTLEVEVEAAVIAENAETAALDTTPTA